MLIRNISIVLCIFFQNQMLLMQQTTCVAEASRKKIAATAVRLSMDSLAGKTPNCTGIYLYEQLMLRTTVHFSSGKIWKKSKQ